MNSTAYELEGPAADGLNSQSQRAVRAVPERPLGVAHGRLQTSPNGMPTRWNLITVLRLHAQTQVSHKEPYHYSTIPFLVIH